MYINQSILVNQSIDRLNIQSINPRINQVSTYLRASSADALIMSDGCGAPMRLNLIPCFQ